MRLSSGTLGQYLCDLVWQQRRLESCFAEWTLAVRLSCYCVEGLWIQNFWFFGKKCLIFYLLAHFRDGIPFMAGLSKKSMLRNAFESSPFETLTEASWMFSYQKLCTLVKHLIVFLFFFYIFAIFYFADHPGACALGSRNFIPKNKSAICNRLHLTIERTISMQNYIKDSFVQ